MDLKYQVRMGVKILYVVNVDWFFLSHRLPLAIEAQKRGYDVSIAAIETGKKAEIEKHGFTFFAIPTNRSSTNILQEINVLIFIWKLYKKIKPDIVHHVGVKPVTYGSIIGKLLKLPKVVNALSGMGYLFINRQKHNFTYKLVIFFFKFGFNNSNLRFILQNRDDINDLRKLNVLHESQIYLIKGSGVNLNEFCFAKLPDKNTVRIILVSRMLWDKGVGEFVEAARILQKKYNKKAQFILVGDIDDENKSAIKESQLILWKKEGCIDWLGFRKDIIDILRNADIVVLPSYREGLPKSLIEACAIGRPVITTDVPGCREVVSDGENGFIVPAKNSIALAYAMERLILDKKLRVLMGKKAREFAENNFSIESVIEKTFEIYNS